MAATPVPEHLKTMVRRSPPDGVPVVAGSTPVVAFGDPTTARVATLALNPSHLEFVTDGSPLTGERRRLSTLQSLDAVACRDLTDAQTEQVLADCFGYFERNPYGWFSTLDSLLQEALGVSYYQGKADQGTACHLDVSQWATDPAWKHLTGEQQRVLLDDGAAHLAALLSESSIQLVLVNGARVRDEVARSGLAEFEDVGKLGDTSYSLFAGFGSGCRWVGWTAYLQRSGLSAQSRKLLVEHIRQAAAEG